jgi:hypothetical protein
MRAMRGETVRKGLLATLVVAAASGCSASSNGGKQNGDGVHDGGAGRSSQSASAGGGGSSGAGGVPATLDGATPPGTGGEAGSKENAGGSGGAGAHDGGGGMSSGGSHMDIDITGAKLVPNTPGVRSSAKLDLLLVVDNSISMGDKQEVLARSIPDLVTRITDPASGVRDLHVAVVTSSLGGHGSTICAGNETGTASDQEQDDHGHFIATRPRFNAGAFPGAEKPTPEGFLTWTPSTGTAALESGIEAMVAAAGEFGCGLESQLEAMYRALVDPHPYATIQVQTCAGSSESCATPTGLDTALLEQRKAFLRSDSVVAIVELTDENDCSIREDGQYYYAARSDVVLPHGSSACATNPNDPCCYFCNAAVPDGCTADPECKTPLPAAKDAVNLRCFHQKERFGFDFLYPTARYATALSRTELCTSRADLLPVVDCPDADGDGNPDLVHNPLFWDTTDSNKPTVRDPSMVYLLGIVGVPYQDLQIAAKADRIDYRSPTALAASKTWDVVLGEAAPPGAKPPVLPTDTLMVESMDPRNGDDAEDPPMPLVGTAGGYLANPVNGHEWVNSARDDLEYACIFPLPDARDCAKLLSQDPSPGCDCKPGNEADHDPVCQQPNGSYSTVQGFAKAYPGLRELDVIRQLGMNGLAASICTRNLVDDSRQDYGYRPAIDLLLDQVRQSAP